MSNMSLAFGLLAFITGFSLFMVAVDTSIYNYPPRDRWKWMLGFVIATLVFAFLAILTNGKTCEDYTAQNYKYGEVPISCAKATDLQGGKHD